MAYPILDANNLHHSMELNFYYLFVCHESEYLVCIAKIIRSFRVISSHMKLSLKSGTTLCLFWKYSDCDRICAALARDCKIFEVLNNKLVENRATADDVLDLLRTHRRKASESREFYKRCQEKASESFSNRTQLDGRDYSKTMMISIDFAQSTAVPSHIHQEGQL